MEGGFVHIAHCIDLKDEDIVRSVKSRESTKELLVHLAGCSAPDTGGAKVLLVFARMASTACEWLDGDLVIDLSARDGSTVIEAVTELGGGMRERALPALTFHAPLHEFARAIARVPRLIAPLRLLAQTDQRVTLSASEAIRRTSVPPRPIEISEESLYARSGPETSQPAGPAPGEVRPAARDVDSGWDE